jgi:hypothetical protein
MHQTCTCSDFKADVISCNSKHMYRLVQRRSMGGDFPLEDNLVVCSIPIRLPFLKRNSAFDSWDGKVRKYCARVCNEPALCSGTVTGMSVYAAFGQHEAIFRPLIMLTKGLSGHDRRGASRCLPHGRHSSVSAHGSTAIFVPCQLWYSPAVLVIASTKS